DVPYQLAIVSLDAGGRLTARVLGKTPEDRAQIGDRVAFVEERDDVVYYRKLFVGQSLEPRTSQ
ncbi:MAG TPA: OB-fold domain-containing protein, partial [Bryobacteraceae bacterium]|nr:OB-fold domain-containing protein [Bryobacteraceae bacterium]